MTGKDVTKTFTVGDNRLFSTCIAPRSGTTVLLNTFTSTCNIHLFRSFSGKSNLY